MQRLSMNSSDFDTNHVMHAVMGNTISPAHAETELHVLLVEDDSGDAAYITEVLETSPVPCAITHLKRGDEVVPYMLAINGIKQTVKPDLILLDIGLPGTDGFEVLRELSRLPMYLRDMPILVQTGYDEFTSLQEEYPLFIWNYAIKPCPSTVLHQLCEYAARCRMKNAVLEKQA